MARADNPLARAPPGRTHPGSRRAASAPCGSSTAGRPGSRSRHRYGLPRDRRSGPPEGWRRRGSQASRHRRPRRSAPATAKEPATLRRQHAGFLVNDPHEPVRVSPSGLEVHGRRTPGFVRRRDAPGPPTRRRSPGTPAGHRGGFVHGEARTSASRPLPGSFRGCRRTPRSSRGRCFRPCCRPTSCASSLLPSPGPAATAIALVVHTFFETDGRALATETADSSDTSR